MFDTGIRQLRMALSMVWGWRLDTANLERLVSDARATIAEFGEPGTDVEALIDGPQADPAARDHFAMSNLRRTARRLDARSPFYARRFAAAGVDARQFGLDELRKLPVTVKADLIATPADFLCTGVEKHLATRTTGTTGRPAEIWLSRYETELYPALFALGAVLRSVLRPTDVMQVNVSSRATISMHMDVAVCRLSGAGCRLVGIVPPDEALDSLADGVTVLSTPASYLGELVTAARRRGLGPADFPMLRRVESGGEVLSPALARAAGETFGADQVLDAFGMTEVIPVTGTTCDQGHLHHDINRGYVEFLDLETGEPAAPGALATVVISPYYPYRECMPVFRYDTRDLVRRLPDEPLTCSLAMLPGCSKVLGKADHLLRVRGGAIVTPRELVEAIDALPTEPWPARFSAVAVDGRVRLTLPEYAVAGFGPAAAERHFADHGLDVDLSLVPDEDALALRPLRCDLRETTFVARPALIGA